MFQFSIGCLLLPGIAEFLTTTAAGLPNPQGPVSYFHHVRPIFQANCQGCHQPAKSKGGYVMTSFDAIFKPGESKETPVSPGKPDASHLLNQILPKGGEAEMPKGKPPLHELEVEVVRRWIAEGAKDDTPASAKVVHDAEHPPRYSRQPIVTSLDYSPDGSLLAIAGFHEILLRSAETGDLVGRLIGVSDRIQTVRFSPDGKWLAAAGGQPSRSGEIQVWDVEKRKLVASAPAGYDTAYGVSWSPDGKTVAFGLPDKTVRAIEAATGKQVLQQGSHNDWVLDTVFSLDGAHVVSVGRDMSAKLTEVATQRFVDNITSITPGALRGGLQSVARHPSKNEILVGGADGIPQIYQMFRKAARKIGDNAALLRRFPEMEGRVSSVDYSPDGNLVAAASTLDGRSTLSVFSAQFDGTIPTNILKTYEKTSGEYSKDEKDAIEKFVTADIRQLASTRMKDAAIYALSFHPDGRRLAISGSDGLIRVLVATNSSIDMIFAAAPVEDAARSESDVATRRSRGVAPEIKSEPRIDATDVTSLKIHPEVIRPGGRNEQVQLLVTATLKSGDTADVTRLVKYSGADELGAVSTLGRYSPEKSGTGRLQVQFGTHATQVPVEQPTLPDRFAADFVRDVNPVLSKLGCNQGTCHGAKDGKEGFKLSLRGYDPIYDIRALTDDLGSRRVNFASPDDSLMLLKAVSEVPHEGGQRTTRESAYYAVLRQWIESGARLDAKSPRVTGIEMFPKDPVVQQIGSLQQIRIVASYSDNTTRDVTAEAFIESGNLDIATTDTHGLVTTLRRGEAPILARYEGNYAATTVTVMGDRSGFTWQEPPKNNRIDELVAAKWKRMKILPSDSCTDSEFIRRVSLDLTGLPPTVAEVGQFLENSRDSRSKRDALIEKLLNSPEYVDHWANKWADLLQVNRKFLGEEGSRQFREWIHQEIRANTPYNEFVHKILTATGSNKDNPAAGYWKTLRGGTETMENTTHLFLATRFNCNKCHDHPFERWTQDQYYHLSQYFAQVDLKKDDASGDKKIGGTAVDGAKPLYEIVYDKTDGDIKHDRTSKVVPPSFPYPAGQAGTSTNDTRRQRLSAWITSPDNRYFALSYVNRLWGYLTGVGLIEPLDDIRAGNPAGNPELLDHLTREFVESGFNTRHIVRQICQSRTYQLSLQTHKWNEDDKVNYSHAMARRLPAEVLLDSVFRVTGSQSAFPGMKAGMRAAQLPDSGIDLPSGFLANLGRPPRESSCECERSNDIKLGSVMSLLSGPAVSGAVNDLSNDLARLIAREADNRKVVNEVFLRVLNRPAATSEVEKALEAFNALEAEHHRLTNELAAAESAWAKNLPTLEERRAKEVGAAEKDLVDHVVRIAPENARSLRAHAEKMASADQAVREHRTTLSGRSAAWEKSLIADHTNTTWTVVDAREIRATTGSVKLEKLPDGVIRSSGSRGELPDYVITADTSLTNITGLKLEVLTDADAPQFGPGYKDGNFLLSEIAIESSPKGSNQFSFSKITNGVASYIEPGYEIRHSFDGRVEQGRREGWTVGGRTGEPHWAAFAFQSPITNSNGSNVRIFVQHRYEAPFEIARFRLSLTTSPQPLAEGLNSELAGIVKTPVNSRNPSQLARLQSHIESLDPEMRRREHLLSLASKPLPPDSRRQDLELALTRAARPVATDPALLQLRMDVAASARQLDHPRLTAVQDLVWAMINTPSFLFNR